MHESASTAPRLPSLWLLWLAVLGFGALVNLLMLTSPLFMLQVYDRVLPARSGPTLFVLFAMVAFLFASMAAIDSARARLLARIGTALVLRYEGPVFTASFAAKARVEPAQGRARAMSDLDALRKVFASSAVSGVLDAPWSVVFIGLLFVLHPMMGVLALGGGLVLMSLAVFDQRLMSAPRQLSLEASARAEGLLQDTLTNAPDFAALGMGNALLHRWLGERRREMHAHLLSQDRHSAASSLARALRLFLQSAMLALGAWLVLDEQLSPGLMIASSILMGRVLSPVEQLATQWMALRSAWLAWGRVRRLGANARASAPFSSGVMAKGTAAAPKGDLIVSNLVVGTPETGAPLLRIAGFQLAPGEAMGVIGPSGAGKSLLARSLIGATHLHAGTLLWGDQSLPLDPVGVQSLGYLSQTPSILPGTIHDNIARLHALARPDDVIRVARAVGLHEAIMALPCGYSTELAPDGAPLSGGELQRLGLARALYGPSGLVILDEPAAHLDAHGLKHFDAVLRALKERGSIVIIMSQRPAAIRECDWLLRLEHGAQVAFGPRDDVLRSQVKNHADLDNSNPARGQNTKAPRAGKGRA